MVKMSQHPAGGGCRIQLKMRNFCAWFIISLFTSKILCAVSINGKKVDAQITSTVSSTEDASEAQTYSEKNFLNTHSNEHSDHLRILRAVPRVKTTNKSSTDDKSKNFRQLDYVVKIPLSLIRQLELARVLMLQDRLEESHSKKRFSVIPIPQYGRSGYRNEYELEGTDNMFQYVSSEEDNSPKDLGEEEADNSVSEIRNSRSMLLLSAQKSEDTSKEKPSQTFVLPYPRPGRSIYEDELSRMLTLNDYKKKYVLPTARFGRSNSDTILEKEEDVKVVDDWVSSAKYSPGFLKLNKVKMSGNTEYEPEENSFFVIPYPRPGKKSMFKLKNRNQEQKNSEKDITDYMLPYPRPGKKSERELVSSKQKSTENIGSLNLILPHSRSEEIDDSFSDIPYENDFSDVLNVNRNIEVGNNKESLSTEEYGGIFGTLNKKSENKFLLPNLRTRRNFDKIVPYPRPGRSLPNGNVALELFSDKMYPDSNKLQFPEIGMRNSKDIFRYKRSASVLPYPRLGRSNAVVPYPRLGQSDSVLPYPRIGRTDFVVPHPRLGGSNSLHNDAVLYPKLSKANTFIPYPFSGKSKRSSSVLSYTRLGRSDSLLPYPRPGRSESVVPYPRPGRAESIVPYPRAGRAESLVPYPRPGRSDSIVPYPRPGRSDSLVPYPRPGRSDSLVPYPRPGRTNSVVPYPRPGRSPIQKTDLENKYGKEEKWLLPNLRPGRSNLKQEYNRKKLGNIASNLQSERSDNEHNSEYTNSNSNALSKVSSISRYGRASDDQGYVLPHPRIGRSLSHARKKRESFDTDTVIPYPRLGRSQKETVPLKIPPETQDSVHKLNKHMLTSLEDSVYLLPYPRPGRYSE